MKSPLRKIVGVVGVLAACFMAGCGVQPKEKVLSDAPLDSFQSQLLETAFEVATAMPVNPHLKSRSRAQEEVAQAALKLNQPQRVLVYADQIGNWRRGQTYADFAFYSVQHGVTNGLASYLDLAEKIAQTATQDWRRDAVLARIAQVQGLIKEYEEGALSSGEEIPSLDQASFDKELGRADEMLQTGMLDDVKAGLNVCIRLYERNYGDEECRAAAEKKIRDSWKVLPVFLRIEFLKKMASVSLANEDQDHALQLVDDAHELMVNNTWPVHYRIPLAADLAALKFRSGAAEAARHELDEAIQLFDQKQNEIVNIDKREALVPVAEAAWVMGDADTALTIYKQAVESSVENPNSRPRAEDLSAICLSMALTHVEPDAGLWARIKEIQAGLGDPW